MYVDKVKLDSKQRLRKFLELNEVYGMVEDDLTYLLISEMIMVFLLNAEEFRANPTFNTETSPKNIEKLAS